MTSFGAKPHLSDDVIDDILTDHRELEDYYEKYKKAVNNEEGEKWFN